MSSATQTLDKTASDQSWIAWSAILSGLVRAFAWSSPSSMEVTKRTRELWYQGRGRVMGAVMGLERVGIRDNFFDLGGHSLLAVRLTSAIQRELGVNIGLVMLFANPTIEELALALEEKALESMNREAHLP